MNVTEETTSRSFFFNHLRGVFAAAVLFLVRWLDTGGWRDGLCFAACAALETLTRPCRVVVHTDSEYVKNGITRWHTGWVRRNWRNAAGDPVANMDLWRRLLAAAAQHEIEWKWVRGHAGNAMNERADQLATAARES